MPGMPALSGRKHAGASQVDGRDHPDAYRRPPSRARRRSGWQPGLVATLTVVGLAVAGGYYLRVHRPAPPPPTARQVWRQAAARFAALKSVSATFTTQVGGLTVLYGSVQEQVQPAQLASLTMTTVDGADRFPVSEVVSNAEAYLGIPAIVQATGKPWIGVPVAQLTADPALAQLSATSAIPTSQVALLALAGKVRLAGAGTVGRVPASRYVGTVDPAALTGLSPTLRRLLAPELKSGTGLVSFVAWIDGEHNFRKIQTTTATIGGLRTVTTIVCTAINKTVQIAVPLAGQVTNAPFSGLPAGLVPASAG